MSELEVVNGGIVISPVIQCNHVDFEGAVDVSLRKAPDGRFVIEKVIENAKCLSADTKPIIACPDLEDNKIYDELAKEYNVECYMGDNLNIAQRLMGAADKMGATHIAWLQGLLYFLDTDLMDSMIEYAVGNSYDYVRCVDGTCKHWCGQYISIEALKRAISLIENLESDEQAHFKARPLAYMRSNPSDFKVGLFDELPKYTEAHLKKMRNIARGIHVGGERAEHSNKGSVIGDVSIGRYREVLPLVGEGVDVLDIACGNGYGSNLMLEKGANVIGVDVDEKVVGKARESYGADIEFKIGNGVDFPIKENSIDLVVSVGTIEHVPDDENFVKEMHRVLRSNGTAVIYTPQNRLGAIPTWPWHEREYSIEGLKKIFIANDFDIEGIWGWQNGVVTQDDPRGDGTYLIANKR